ncbi:branched-chain amino acid ABC transporter permease [Pollutimonas bauzanensis]|uniref:Branched-chain amino acid transport system permease protein n=1 Tax=Pollutimonas bauzanensis TaxID=658167 RepID=A0A1M5QZR3_9BURK|nr:branched-chain amino acid ABC transporter permease [Pollutimonas bauzanensis]SHH19290.1 branched-chain amino acid transport system permease protein [Pollutimonas bauzanensis]
MSAFIQTLVDGILIGGVYGVIAVGLSLVFGVLKIVNFAQAEFLMVGMYAAWFAWSYLGLDPIFGAFIALGVGFLLGALCQRLFVQYILDASPVAQIFLTVGLLAVLENGALLIFGSDFRSVRTPYQTMAFEIGPIFLSVPYVVAFVSALAMSLLLGWLLNHTWTGRAIRATSQNRDAAQLFGIDTRFIYTIAFGLGTGLTAFGGGIILSYTAVSPTAGAQFVVLMFTVVVLGGLGSVQGALVGGIIVGIIQSVSTLFMPIQLQNLVLFVVFITVLAFRPQGLLGRVAR